MLDLVIGSNMKKVLKYGAVSFLLLLLFSFSNPEKKIHKLIKKVWKDVELSMKQVELEYIPVNITQLNKVFGNNELLGYACYTYSTGCKVGGCSAPSPEKRDETYEVFEYIIIYDTNLIIQKVDIANYGGDYGYEICRPGWLKQFKGKKNGFELNKNIDGIAGATISATYLIYDINSLSDTLEVLKSKNEI